MNIRIKTRDVLDIVRALVKYCIYRKDNSFSCYIDEDMARKVLDYAIEQALINNIELKQQIENIVKDSSLKDMIANREMVLSDDEINDIYIQILDVLVKCVSLNCLIIKEGITIIGI